MCWCGVVAGTSEPSTVNEMLSVKSGGYSDHPVNCTSYELRMSPSVSTNYSVFANSSIFEGKKLLEYSFEDGSNIFEFMPQCWLMR